MNLEGLLQRADIWRGGEASLYETGHTLPSGNPELDERIGGGWPLGTLTELLLHRPGIGELRLLLPALARLSAHTLSPALSQEERGTRGGPAARILTVNRWLAWVAPPHLPYAPALVAAGVDLTQLLLIRPRHPQDALWAMEQALRSGACGAVLGWPAGPDFRALRRLQLATEAGGGLGILFRPLTEASQTSPAALRLRLEPSDDGLTVHILKRPGGWAGRPVLLSLP